MGQHRPNIERVQVAATLRRMREQAQVTREQAADVLGCTTSKIGDLETGRSAPRPAELVSLLNRYGVAGEDREDLVEFARASRRRRPRSPYTAATIPTTHRRAVDLESQAISSTFYSGELVPGILQVRPYAEAILRWGNTHSPEEVKRLLELRMSRGSELIRTDRPPLRYWCVLGEAALRSNLGGLAVMYEQLERLVAVNLTLENVVVQVLPLGAGTHSFLGVTVALHRFPPPAPDLLATDNFDRDSFSDREAEVALAAHHLDLLKAKALGRDESTDYIKNLLTRMEAS
ncbi:MAG: helix-turn-helix domain-containing protein [Pseudonocardiaceae bacterium]